MSCRLDGAKPLSKPMLEYCQLDPKEQTSMKFQSEFKHFHSRKCTSKCRLQNGVHFVSASMSYDTRRRLRIGGADTSSYFQHKVPWICNFTKPTPCVVNPTQVPEWAWYDNINFAYGQMNLMRDSNRELMHPSTNQLGTSCDLLPISPKSY